MGFLTESTPRRNIMGIVQAILLLCNGFVLFGQASTSTLQLYPETGHTVKIAEWSHDGRLVATGSIEDLLVDRILTVKIWDAESGRELWTTASREGRIGSSNYVDTTIVIRFSPSEYLLAVVIGTKLKLIDIRNGKELLLEGDGRYLTSVAFAGRYLAAGGIGGGLRLWSLSDGRAENEFKLNDGTFNTIVAMAYSATGEIVSVHDDGAILSWDLRTGNHRTIVDHASAFGYPGSNHLVTSFSMMGTVVAAIDSIEDVLVWDTATGAQLLKVEKPEHEDSWIAGRRPADFDSVLTSYLGDKVYIGTEKDVLVADLKEKRHTRLNKPPGLSKQNLMAISPSGDRLLFGGNKPTILHLGSHETFELTGKSEAVGNVAGSPNGMTLALEVGDSIKLWDLKSATGPIGLSGVPEMPVSQLAFSGNGRALAAGGSNGVAMWEILDDTIAHRFFHSKSVTRIAFRNDGHQLAFGTLGGSVSVTCLRTADCTRVLSRDNGVVVGLAYSDDGRYLGLAGMKGSEKVAFRLYGSRENDSPRLISSVDELSQIPGLEKSIITQDTEEEPTFYDGRLKIARRHSGMIDVKGITSEKTMFSLWLPSQGAWLLFTPDGRFDSNMSMDTIEGLHWKVNNEILNPVPLEAFMRQYYEPGLLQRLIRCNEARESNKPDPCEKEFKPLPPISEINRVQSKVGVPRITAVNDDQTVNVTVEVESTTEKVTINANDHSQKKELTSGVYDLRLFRDGQLIGTSTSRKATQDYIGEAPEAVEKDRAAYARDQNALFNTNEDGLWRNANVIIPNKLGLGTYSGNICVIDNKTPTKAVCTFRNVPLPRDHRLNEVEFTAYAFNADRVKSDTVSFKYSLPKSITSAPPQKGRAYLISIGVNASENPLWNLQYAANDAREMQKVLGPKLIKEEQSGRYSEVVQIPLISARDAEQKNDDPNPKENTATKEIIKGVFSLLAGNRSEVSQSVFDQIPNAKEILRVQPEDTVIITFAGHGYADQAGIFYLMPFDVGRDTTAINPGVLRNLISSDELSLWMQDITATEMIMIIDACHSAAAIQGDGFKPGPMGSRGLGQLAYDKGMKLLAATQADNVALEIGKLQQGLLSFVLLNDAITEKRAAPDGKDSLTATEWLTYAVQAVPKLYDDVRAGRRSVVLNARNTEDWKKKEFESGDLFFDTGEFERRIGSVQQPTVFDFRKREKDRRLIPLN